MIAILNDTPITVNEQQMYHERNRRKYLVKGRRQYEENQEWLKKMALD